MEDEMDGNQQLINHLIGSGALRSPSLIDAFQQCDRLLFIPEELYPDAYEDRPLPIGKGQTISQPYTVAIMLELLHPQPGEKILDIGSGSGWTTALLAAAVGTEGFVEGIEIIPHLVEYGRESLHKARITNASIASADPLSLGRAGEVYDRILVSASAPEMPSELFDQLKPEGTLVIPVRNSIWRVTKEADGSITRYELPGFVFVPLIM